MNRIVRTPVALAGLSFALAVSGCGSDADAEPTSSATTTTAGSPSASPPPAHDASDFPDMTAAQAFTTFAVTGSGEVPWAAAVTYRIDGEQVARFGPVIADRPAAWDRCPAGTTTYEGRECPVSPLRTVAGIESDGGEVVYESTAPRVIGCKRYRAAAANAATTMWIRPNKELRDCFSDFAVALSLNESGRIRSVDFALSGP